MENTQTITAPIQSSFASVTEFASAHKESAIVGTAAATTVGLAWMATHFLNRRKTKAAMVQQALSDQLKQAQLNVDVRRKTLAALEEANFIGALRTELSEQIKRWDAGLATELAQKQGKGTLTSADIESIKEFVANS